MGQALKLFDMPAGDVPLGMEFPSTMTFGQWEAEGRRLSQMSHALQWYVGDWWNAGLRFGEETRAETAKRLFGLEYGTVMNCGSVARRFPISRRRENLSFSQHVEAVSLGDEQAVDQLLERAISESLTVRDLRAEVQAIKAANDPKPGEVRTEEQEPKASPQPLSQRELIAAYEAVIELAEALQQLRELTRREMDLVSIAQSYLEDAHSERRPCPEDFDIIFVEKGRIECETWYRCSRITVNRWLIERGKRRLIEARAAFVKHERDKAPPEGPPASVIDDDVTLLPIAQKAAHFLRASRYGGWTITKRELGGWCVGTVVKTSDQLIAMAERQGFDRTTAATEGEEHF